MLVIQVQGTLSDGRTIIQICSLELLLIFGKTLSTITEFITKEAEPLCEGLTVIWDFSSVKLYEE